jgi:DNA-3-methyladenine glycosylase I
MVDNATKSTKRGQKIMQPTEQIKRCDWATSDLLYQHYHDEEWGVPVHDDRLLFEFLILEGMQAGLSWFTILKKREAFRECFDNFEAKKIAVYDQHKINTLMQDVRIIRNALKIQSAITNAQAFLALTKQQSFADYLWQFVDNKPVINHWKNKSELPASTALSDKLSRDLKKRGFKFIGTTICYAFMQAVGMVNDHMTHCFLYNHNQK